MSEHVADDTLQVAGVLQDFSRYGGKCWNCKAISRNNGCVDEIGRFFGVDHGRGQGDASRAMLPN